MKNALVERLVCEQLSNAESPGLPGYWDLGVLERLRLKYGEAIDLYDVASEYDIPIRVATVNELTQVVKDTTVARSPSDPQVLIQEFGVLMGDTRVAEHPGPRTGR